jgi:hypothetical protein
LQQTLDWQAKTNQLYQVWLVTTGIPMSLGFVTPDAQGRVDVAFDTPPELRGNVAGSC